MCNFRPTGFFFVLCIFCWIASCEAAEPGTWSGFKEEFISSDGRVIDFYQQEISHSEGQGYSMLLAVAFGDRETFSLLWQWTKKHLQVRKTDALSAWSWGELANGVTTAPIDFNNATDGDICIAWALLLARERWNLPVYEDEGRRIVSSIQRYLLMEAFGETIILPGYYGFTRQDAVVVNPSYLVLPAFKVFARYSDQTLWERVHTESLTLLTENSFGRWQLPADWLLLRRDTAFEILADKAPLFGYEAIRVLLWASWDGALAQLPGVEKLLDLIQSTGKLPVTIDLLSDRLDEQEAPAGFFAIAANCAGQLNRESQASALWRQAEQKIQHEERNYFSHVLYLLARSRRIP